MVKRLTKHHTPKDLKTQSEPKKTDVRAPPIQEIPEALMSGAITRVTVIEEWDDNPQPLTLLTTEEWETGFPTSFSTLTTEEWSNTLLLTLVTTETWVNNPPPLTLVVTESWA